jgi:transcriptional regulator GlxA family with amidase domain
MQGGSNPKPRLIALVVPPNAQSLDVSGPLDTFLEANRQSDGRAGYELRLVAITMDRTIRAGVVSLVADSTIFDDDGPIDTLLVCGTPDYNQAYENSDVPDWLRRHCAQARRYGSVCTGAFYLGTAGLLDGRNVTTHWQHAAELPNVFPPPKSYRTRSMWWIVRFTPPPV